MIVPTVKRCQNLYLAFETILRFLKTTGFRFSVSNFGIRLLVLPPSFQNGVHRQICQISKLQRSRITQLTDIPKKKK